MKVWPGISYLCLKAFHQDGHQQVEEDIVAEGHEGDEVEGGDGRGGGHAVIQHLVPILLRQDLRERGGKIEKQNKKTPTSFSSYCYV